MTEATCQNCGQRAAIGTRGRQLRYCSSECRNEYPSKRAREAREAARSIVSKTCQQCDRHLPLGDFHKDRRRTDGHYPWCKDCRRTYMGASAQQPARFNSKREYDIAYRAKKKAERAGRKVNTSHLWTHFRMTVEEYDLLLAEQNGHCAICDEPGVPYESSYRDGDRRLAVDHDHACCPGSRSCGSCVRGLLCQRCNTGLGFLNDDAALLYRAVDYLSRSRDGAAKAGQQRDSVA
jgi:hypothetical protein